MTEAGPAPEKRGGWRERWLAFRNRTVASPGFQRWAAGFPLTRRIAQRNTRALFDLCAGFVYAQVLFACVRLDLFTLLRDGPLAPDALARRLDLPADRALTLLKAAASLDLITRLPDGRFALADLGAALIGNPSVAAMIEHHAMLYADLADPVALLRGEAGPTRLGGYWPYAEAGEAAQLGPDSVSAYSGLMAASQALIADDVLDALPLADRACLMDVGGGEGVFLAQAARRHPGLALRLLDLPPVAERAGARLAAEGLGNRVTCLGRSFLGASLPEGADAITLVRVVHDHDDAVALALLRAAHAALPPGGLLAIAEPMAGTPGAEPVGDAYFGFYLLAMGSGRPRTADELTAMLTQAGFREIRERPTRRPLLARLITAKRRL
ncbi:acetylserotonin O-methyltransferase [Methylorubrum extorquens]|uniref:acetylserotonin O-methyltransferase n=1 Tax=Methylorubrum extorquens TaxID=408 RepID=UPI0022391437|nr:acetylserotonin O-methyltransferase [Methylorubrum extorquens]UYW29611.1 acetylserotonin O-methyltransferase [Methylorubrum extorquens]UYW35207.1 acetylserotonin O-methyltransferase [Methylorubrum extorquens]